MNRHRKVLLPSGTGIQFRRRNLCVPSVWVPKRGAAPHVALLLLLLITSVPLKAQRTVEGVVRSSEGELLGGVTIRVVERNGLGTVSDYNGHYRLALPVDSTYTIEASMVGMEPQRCTVGVSQKGRVDLVLVPKKQNLKTVVVTATRTPRQLKDVPVVTRVLAANEIQKIDVNNVQELLQVALPGIEYSYTMNQQLSLNMQGFGGNSVLFLVDGERLAGETLDNVDYSRLSLESADRVEIVKGALSSLYGSNAVGGVVNVITRQNEDPWSLTLNSRYGTFNNLLCGGAIGLCHNGLRSYSSFRRTSCDPIQLPKDGDFGIVYGNRTLDANQRFVFTPARGLKFTARVGYYFRERESQTTSYDRYRDFSGGGKAEYSPDTMTSLTISYAFDQYDKSDYAVVAGTDVRDYSNVQHTTHALYSRNFGGGSTATVGGDFMRDYLMSYQFAVDDRSHLQYTSAAFAQWEWVPARQINILCAARYDYYSGTGIGHFSPKANLMYKWPHVSVRASYAEGFRAASLKEMYMDFDMANIFTICGNPDLLPEVSHNYSIATEYSRGCYDALLMAFHNRVEGRVTTVWNRARGAMVYENMMPLSLSGVDFSTSAHWSNGLGGCVSCMYVCESLSPGTPRSSGTRPFTATMRIDYSRRCNRMSLNCALSGRILSAVTVDEYSSLTDLALTYEQTYPAYTLWRFTATIGFDNWLSLTATIDNIFNYVPEYYYSNSPATTGITVAGGMSVSIDKLASCRH